MALRGGSFNEMFAIFKRMAEALPSVAPPARPHRLAIICTRAGLAPGDNPAVRAAVRLGWIAASRWLGIHGSFQGLIDGRIAGTHLGAMSRAGPRWRSAEFGHQPADPRTVRAALRPWGARWRIDRVDGLLIGRWLDGLTEQPTVCSANATAIPPSRFPLICLPPA